MFYLNIKQAAVFKQHQAGSGDVFMAYCYSFSTRVKRNRVSDGVVQGLSERNVTNELQ